MQPSPRRLSGWKRFVVLLWLIGSLLTFAFPYSVHFDYRDRDGRIRPVWQGHEPTWEYRASGRDRWEEKRIPITPTLFQELALTAACGVLVFLKVKKK